MKVDKSVVSDIAHLCRLEMNDTEQENMAKEMSKILNWMEKLNEVNTDHVEPLIHMSTEVNVLRDDKPGNILQHKRALQNAPKKDSNYFRVPKVIE